MRSIRTAITLLCVSGAPGASLAVGPVTTPRVVHQVRGTGGLVASPHPLATEAGLAVLRDGGNAIDAAVAVGLTLGVVDGHNSGIGGGCFMLVRFPAGRIMALDGREMAPAAAERDMYLGADRSADTTASKTGPRASGIPGSLAVYDHALGKYGRTSLATRLESASRIAGQGFRIDARFAVRLRAEHSALERFAGKTSPVFREDGSLLEANALLVQKDLAGTYRAIAKHGIAWFYGGPYAVRCAAWMQDHGGTLTRDDFANYKLRTREVLRTTYRGHEIVGFPPPSSGGPHVGQILNILEPFDLAGMDAADRTHLIIEAMKLAFADRAYWLGDPDHAKVPTSGLVSKAYARRLAARIDLTTAAPVPTHGNPLAPDDAIDKHTAHFTTLDQHGCWVACTATLNTSFGSKVVIPGTGVFLNNQMDDFSIRPGVPNAFGLVGAEANAIASGKRPLSSMAPTIVLKDGQPVLTVGAAGGPTIITQVLLAIVRTIDLGESLEDAVTAPRFHHQWSPDQVLIESGMNPKVIAELKRRGHVIKRRATFGTTQAIARPPAARAATAVSDPRATGAAGAAGAIRPSE